MSGLRRIALIAGGTILGVAVAATLSLAGLLFTGPGNTLMEPLVGWLSGGTVSVTGLRGSLPDKIRARTVDISDAQGVWLHVENLVLDWNALHAIGNHIDIQTIAASKIVVLQRPLEDSSSAGTTPRIDIAAFDAPWIEIGASVAGHDAMLKASGSLHYLSRHQMRADISAAQRGGTSRYRIRGKIADDIAQGKIAIAEDGKGILGSVLSLPGLGAINLSATAFARDGANHIAFDLSAGALRASGAGTFALAERQADVDVTADAPAMKPAAEFSWASAHLDGHMHGAFDAPRLEGRLSLRDIAASGTHIAALDMRLQGRDGAADLSGTAAGVRIPGPYPDLFVQAPVVLAAHADLRAAARPVTFTISHPLLRAQGRLETGKGTKLAATATLPALEPFAQIAGQDLRGSASVNIDIAQDAQETQLSANGRIDAEGASLLARILGRNAAFALHMTTHEADIVHSDASIVGKALDFHTSGQLRAGNLAYTVAIKSRDVSQFSRALAGNASLSGQISGPIDAADTSVEGNATIASPGFQPHRIDLTAQTKGFPRLSSGQLRIFGIFNAAPVLVKAELSKKDSELAARATAVWKSLRLDSAFVIPRKSGPSGKAKIDIGQLADLSPLLAMRLEGRLVSTVDLASRGNTAMASVRGQLSGIVVENTKIDSATVAGTIADPFGAPMIALDLSAHHVASGNIGGDATAKLTGSLHNLEIAAGATLDDSAYEPARLSATAHFDLNRNLLSLERMSAQWRGQSAMLKAPARIDLRNGIMVDRIDIKVGGGEVTLTGQLMPALNASMAIRAIDAGALETFASTPMQGALSADAKLRGTLEEPHGTFAFHIRDLVAAAYFPRTPVDADAQGELRGKSASLDAKISAGSSAQIVLAGEVPLHRDGSMKVHVQGNADLAFTDLVLAADGRRLRGTLEMDADVLGTPQSPRLRGSGALKNGELQDYARGVHIRAIDAAFSGEGQSLRITKLSGRAGPGTIDGTGHIDFAAPGIPLGLFLQIRNARPVVSDLVTATASGTIHVSGMLEKALSVSGNLDISRGTINIPDRFPPEVAVLDVRRRNVQPPPRTSSGSVALDLSVAASGPIFVRGRGIDADLGGSLHLSGTLAAPIASGGFEMNRGTVSLAGQNLTFTSGKLSFDGSGVRSGIDPSLNFAAQTASGGVTATLTVTGHASKPQIVLSSTPSLPQDEVLARLFFQQSAKQLTPLQLAQIAQAIASLGGVGTGFDPMGALRRNLRLDRLSIGSASGGSSGSTTQTTVEGGKYVARNVYVGARQSLSGSTQIQVQVDLTKQLKAQATVSTGTSANSTIGTAAQDNGNSVGLSYEFEY